MPNDEKKREIKVGITVLVGLVLFVLVVMWAKNFSFGAETQTVNVRFPNVSGLYVKDKVTVNGVEKGYVSDLKIDGNSVIAQLTISADVDLRSDAKFGIVMLDLMGGKKVEINPGTASEKLDLKKIANGKFMGDVSAAMSMFNEMQADLTEIIKQTKEITAAMSSLLNKGNWGDKLSETLANVNTTLEKTNSMLDENSKGIARLVKNGAELSDSLNDFWKNNGAKFSSLVVKSGDALAKADSVLNELNALLRATNTSENNLGKVLNDKEYLKKLNTTLDKLNELVKILIEQLEGEGVNVNTNIF